MTHSFPSCRPSTESLIQHLILSRQDTIHVFRWGDRASMHSRGRGSVTSTLALTYWHQRCHSCRPVLRCSQNRSKHSTWAAPGGSRRRTHLSAENTTIMSSHIPFALSAAVQLPIASSAKSTIAWYVWRSPEGLSDAAMNSNLSKKTLGTSRGVCTMWGAQNRKYGLVASCSATVCAAKNAVGRSATRRAKRSVMCGVGGHRAHLENLAREQRVLVSAVGVVGLGAVRGALVTLAVRFARVVVAIGGTLLARRVQVILPAGVCGGRHQRAIFFSGQKGGGRRVHGGAAARGQRLNDAGR
eukprot:SAG25_NODE_454_length_7870_cov_2.720499_6_plen_299_part_00